MGLYHYLALIKPQFTQFRHFKKEVEKLERIQRQAKKDDKGFGSKLWKEWLRELGTLKFAKRKLRFELN